MPKYFDFKIAGYYLYFTTHCIVECMHVHASDNEFSEPGSAKFFVKGNGDTIVKDRGRLKDKEILKIQHFIKDNYEEMYQTWSIWSDKGYFIGK